LPLVSKQVPPSTRPPAGPGDPAALGRARSPIRQRLPHTLCCDAALPRKSRSPAPDVSSPPVNFEQRPGRLRPPNLPSPGVSEIPRNPTGKDPRCKGRERNGAREFLFDGPRTETPPSLRGKRQISEHRNARAPPALPFTAWGGGRLFFARARVRRPVMSWRSFASKSVAEEITNRTVWFWPPGLVVPTRGVRRAGARLKQFPGPRPAGRHLPGIQRWCRPDHKTIFPKELPPRHQKSRSTVIPSAEARGPIPRFFFAYVEVPGFCARSFVPPVGTLGWAVAFVRARTERVPPIRKSPSALGNTGRPRPPPDLYGKIKGPPSAPVASWPGQA